MTSTRVYEKDEKQKRTTVFFTSRIVNEQHRKNFETQNGGLAKHVECLFVKVEGSQKNGSCRVWASPGSFCWASPTASLQRSARGHPCKSKRDVECSDYLGGFRVFRLLGFLVSFKLFEVVSCSKLFGSVCGRFGFGVVSGCFGLFRVFGGCFGCFRSFSTLGCSNLFRGVHGRLGDSDFRLVSGLCEGFSVVVRSVGLRGVEVCLVLWVSGGFKLFKGLRRLGLKMFMFFEIVSAGCLQKNQEPLCKDLTDTVFRINNFCKQTLCRHSKSWTRLSGDLGRR